MATPAFDPIAAGTSMLVLPKTSRLTDGQRDGENCPWCNALLAPTDRLDLGVRPGPYGIPIHPWACPGCVTAQARLAYAQHGRYCVRCQKDPTRCSVRRLWRRLALETRPAGGEHT
ncbi:hypothetical protein ACFCWT_13630 [Streptomyces olivaceus]|uniref:hypothetical protein n=1 Tax=Streptomyces olivaceus TaxID=47716 RepID=UPI0035D5D113